MAIKIRLGVFILTLFLVCGVMLYCNKEKSLLSLGLKEEVYIVENEKIYDKISYKTNLTPKEIIYKLKALVQSKQNLEHENIEIYNCFVENINEFVVVGGKKVNLQIAFDGKESVIGFPLILTGY